MESTDLESDLYVLSDKSYCSDSYFDVDFDSAMEMDEVDREFYEQLIERSDKPKAAPEAKTKAKPRKAKPAKPSKSKDWISTMLAHFTQCPNEIICNTSLSDAEVRVLLLLAALDWNGKGYSEHAEATMAPLIGKSVRRFQEILKELKAKDEVRQQRRGDHRTAILYPKIRVEGGKVVRSYRHDPEQDD